MSEETRPKTPPKGQAQQQAPKAENPVEEARYTREQLREGARTLLNVSPLIVAGALGRVAENRTTFTLPEAKSLVGEHLNVELDPLEGAA